MQNDQAMAFDLSDWSVLAITGPDRASYLHSFCTNDIKSLVPGSGCEALITNVKGRILGHVLVFAEAERLTLIAVPGSQAVLVPHLTKYLIGVDAEVQDETGTRRLLAFNRPAAEQVWSATGTVRSSGGSPRPAEFGGCQVPDEHWVRAAMEMGLTGGAPCAANAPDLASLPVSLGEHGPWLGSATHQTQALFGRVDLFPGGAWLWLGSTESPDPSLNIKEGENITRGITLGTREQFETLRIAAGFPWVGKDIGEDHLAQEAARIDRTISFKKGCYLGQEPIARLDALGHTNRELRGLLIDSERPPEPGSLVFWQQGEVGRISSSAPGISQGTSVALAVLRTAAGTPGESVEVRTATATLSAVVFWPELSFESEET